MEQKPYTIGVLGGMGTYATIHLFRQYASVFPAQKEWERPRIIIDNRCTMPSRVRAALYGEKREQLVDEMSDSVRNLINSGCDRIILACNTAHLFLSDVCSLLPAAEGRIVNITTVCVDELCDKNENDVFLLASEGTIESGIYQQACAVRGIRCETPGKEDYAPLRDCIEAVKRNRYTDTVGAVFSELIHTNSACVLGCTELPVLYEKYKDLCGGTRVYDPILITFTRLRKEYKKIRRNDSGYLNGYDP